jgi:hypothetical protein
MTPSTPLPDALLAAANILSDDKPALRSPMRAVVQGHFVGIAASVLHQYPAAADAATATYERTGDIVEALRAAAETDPNVAKHLQVPIVSIDNDANTRAVILAEIKRAEAEQA